MKNLENLEKLENLPFKASRKEYITEKYGNMWNINNFDHPWCLSNKTKTPRFILKNVIKKFKGDSFEHAFSYYCKLVNRENQRFFIEYFFPRSPSQWIFEEDFVLVNNIITKSSNHWRNNRNSKNKFNSKKEYYEYIKANRKEERDNIQNKNNKKYFMLTNEELAKKYKLPFDKTSLWLCRHILAELRKQW